LGSACRLTPCSADAKACSEVGTAEDGLERGASDGGTSGAREYIRSALLWLLLASVVEAAWVFARLSTDVDYGRPLALPYNLALLLLAFTAPTLAKHRYLVWVAAFMPLWILIIVALGARHS
jgi:hypothetical protein